jgi:hypothetical protein
VNELLVTNLKWENPVGQVFRMDSIQYEVIGVIRDFHAYSFNREIRPLIFSVAEKPTFRYLSLKVRDGSEIKTFKALQDNWMQIMPEIPFSGGLQEDAWGFFFEEKDIQSRVWDAFAFIAVSLAVLGFYGLVSLNVEGRTKEFSIRKILGAGIRQISGNIFRQYALLLGVAILIGAPLGHQLMKMVMESAFVYHVPIDLSAVTFAVTLLIIILVLTVSTQISKVLKANPVDGLRAE